MDGQIREALGRDRVIDITTIGRKSGQSRRLETWFHNIDGQVYLTGLPGPRDWYANLLANPRFTFHLKESLVADLPAHATPVTDPADREAVFRRILANIDRSHELEAWKEASPLVRVTFEDR